MTLGTFYGARDVYDSAVSLVDQMVPSTVPYLYLHVVLCVAQHTLLADVRRDTRCVSSCVRRACIRPACIVYLATKFMPVTVYVL